MKVLRHLKFVALLLVFTFTCNLSVSFASAQNNRGLSWDKSDRRNSAAHRNFKEDKVVRDIVKNFLRQGYSLDMEKPAFMKYQSADGNDWMAVVLTAQMSDRQVVITGFVNEKSGKVEHAVSTEYVVLDSEKRLVLVNGMRFDHGSLKRQSSALWDVANNRAKGDNGLDLSHEPQRTSSVTFGATANAALCVENLVCSMIYEVVTSVMCAILTVTLIGGLICGITFSFINYIYCYTEYNCD